MKTVKITARAQRDLAEIYGYYSDVVHSKFAQEYVERIYKAISALATHPYLGPPFTTPRGRALRRIVIGNYICVYSLDSNENVRINAIYDGRRNPKGLGL